MNMKKTIKILSGLLEKIGNNLTIKNVFVGLAVVIVVSTAKHFLFGGLTFTLSFNNSIALGIIALITRLTSSGIAEYLMDHHNLGNILNYFLDSQKITLTETTSYHMNANSAPNRSGLRVTIPGGIGTGTGTGTGTGGNVAAGNAGGGNVAGGANPLPANGLALWGDGNYHWGNPSQPAGTRANGPLRINDPYAQAYNGYNTEGRTNQPFARNLSMALEHQLHTHRTSTISRYALSQSHQRFLVDYLRHNDENLYNKVVTITGNNITINIWKLPNSIHLRNSLSNLT